MDKLRNEAVMSRRAFVVTSALLASGLVMNPYEAFADGTGMDKYAELQAYMSDDGIFDFSGLPRTEIDRLLLLQAEFESVRLMADIGRESNSGAIVPFGRPSYSNVYGSPVKARSGARDVGNQPSQGYSSNSAFSVGVALSGGPNVALSFGVPSPWGTTSIGVSFAASKGQGVASAVNVSMPGDNKRRKIKMNIEYESTPYTVYCTDSSGNKSVYRRAHTVPSITGRDSLVYMVPSN